MGQDGDSIVEVRNGSDMVLKSRAVGISASPQQASVWGPGYVDELVQEGINSAPVSQSTCDTFYWACQDANYNLMGLVDSTGVLKERYEYTPYGERKVLFSPGVNDTDLMAPTLMSRRVQVAGANQPYGLCEFGHQGLYHDEELGLIYNRARALSPTLGRFMQRDPLGYVDGKNVYQYMRSNPVYGRDPLGLWKVCCGDIYADHWYERFFYHCDLRSDDEPCSSRTHETSFPAYKDTSSSRTLDGGCTKCSDATDAQIADCLRRHPYSPEGGAWGSNCQSNTIARLSRCCLRSTWQPAIYAGTHTPCLRGHYEDRVTWGRGMPHRRREFVCDVYGVDPIDPPPASPAPPDDGDLPIMMPG